MGMRSAGGSENVILMTLWWEPSWGLDMQHSIGMLWHMRSFINLLGNLVGEQSFLVLTYVFSALNIYKDTMYIMV